MFIPKRWRIFFDEVGITDRAEMERRYAEAKAQNEAEESPERKAERAERKQKKRALHAGLAKDIETWILADVQRIYDRWHQSRKDARERGEDTDLIRRAFPEPQVTIGALRVGLEPTLERNGIYDTKEQFSVVSAALARLLRRGALRSSLGSGHYGRKSETRLYEPGDKPSGGKRRHGVVTHLAAQVNYLLKK